MKPMLLSFVAIVVIAIGANFILGELNFSTENATNSPSVRGG